MPTPRLLMEISKNDEVPKLVSIYDSLPEGKCLGRKSLVVPRKERDINPEMAELRLSLQRERHENEELNLLIKELTVKTDKLKEVNENLIVRIREIENSYHTLRADLERENQSEKRKLKQDIYKDIE